MGIGKSVPQKILVRGGKIIATGTVSQIQALCRFFRFVWHHK